MGHHDTSIATCEYYAYDALRELVLFLEFKKREKHPWRMSVTKSNTHPWVFFTFFKLCKWNRAKHLI